MYIFKNMDTLSDDDVEFWFQANGKGHARQKKTH